MLTTPKVKNTHLSTDQQQSLVEQAQKAIALANQFEGDHFNDKVKKAKRLLGKSDRLILEKGLRAREKLIISNRGIVVELCQLYQNNGIPWEDLEQHAQIGLIHAVEKYSPDKGYKFSTYAWDSVRWQLLHALKTESLPIRLPQKAYTKYSKVKSAVNRLNQKGCFVSLTSLMQESGLSRNEIKQVCHLDYSFTSLDSAVDEDEDSSWHSRCLANAEQEDHDLDEALKILPGSLREFAKEYFGLNDGKPKGTLEYAIAHHLSPSDVSVKEKECHYYWQYL